MKVSGALPRGDADGLSAIEAAALKSQKPIVAVVIFEPTKIDEDLHTRQKELKVGIRRVEALLPEDTEAAVRLLQRSFESRTGESTLPIELENDIRDALKGVQNYVPETTQTESAPDIPDGGYQAMTVPKLTALLKHRGLDYSKGTKTELVGRLEAADAAPPAKPENVVDLFNDGSSPRIPDNASELVDAQIVDDDLPAGDDVASDPVDVSSYPGDVPSDPEEDAWNAAAPTADSPEPPVATDGTREDDYVSPSSDDPEEGYAG